MSKILKSFGMAALLVALLAGTGMAAETDSGSAAVSGTVDTISMELTTKPDATANLGTLWKGKTITYDDTVVITANAAWKLSVKDVSAAPASTPSKMEEYLEGAYTGLNTMNNVFCILVEDGQVATNNAFDTETNIDADRVLTTGDQILLADGTATSGAETGYLRYSVDVHANDVVSTYRSDITYTLAANI
jgi:hypothetical protein